MTAPSEPGPPDIRRVITAIDTLSTELDEHKTALGRADLRARWARATAIVGILVGLIGILYGISARGTADEIQDSRAEARAAGCVQANVTAEKTRAALIAGVSVLSTGDHTPEAQARLDEFVASYTTQVQAALPFRDCSPAGIARYISDLPDDPAG